MPRQFFLRICLQSLENLLQLTELIKLELAQVALVSLRDEGVRLGNEQAVDVVVVLLHELVQFLLLKLLRRHEKDLLANLLLLLVLSSELVQLLIQLFQLLLHLLSSAASEFRLFLLCLIGRLSAPVSDVVEIADFDAVYLVEQVLHVFEARSLLLLAVVLNGLVKLIEHLLMVDQVQQLCLSSVLPLQVVAVVQGLQLFERVLVLDDTSPGLNPTGELLHAHEL